jgi:hypothetical protein
MGFEGANTSAVFVPLVLPKVSIISAEIFPIFAHVFKQVTTAGVDQYEGNVAVLALVIAKLVKAAIAMIGPLSD